MLLVPLRRCRFLLSFASWFELEWAEAQIRAGKPGLAMKKALAVHTHFEDFVEDQFDFHTYCMRKVRCRLLAGVECYFVAPLSLCQSDAIAVTPPCCFSFAAFRHRIAVPCFIRPFIRFCHSRTYGRPVPAVRPSLCCCHNRFIRFSMLSVHSHCRPPTNDRFDTLFTTSHSSFIPSLFFFGEPSFSFPSVTYRLITCSEDLCRHAASFFP